MNYINYPGPVRIWLSTDTPQITQRKEDDSWLLSPYELPDVDYTNPHQTNSIDCFIEHHLMFA